jgi:hypothetical protein
MPTATAISGALLAREFETQDRRGLVERNAQRRGCMSYRFTVLSFDGRSCGRHELLLVA